MYEESNRNILSGWLGFILKLVLLAIFVFILCWLFTRNSGNKVVLEKNYFGENITSMKEAAMEYYTSSKLPAKVGETKKISLNEMLNQKLLVDFTDNGKQCNTSESYTQVTKTADNNYALKVNLTCGKESDYIVTTIEKNNNSNCDLSGKCAELIEKLEDATNKVSSNQTTNTNNSSSKTSSSSNYNNTSNKTSNSSSSTSSSSNKATTTTTTTTTRIKITITCTACEKTEEPVKPEPTTPEQPIVEKTKYYELVRYSEWKTGNMGNSTTYETVCSNETTYTYCLNRTQDYYTSTYVSDYTKYGHTYTYTLKLRNLSGKSIDSAALDYSSQKHFTSIADYRNYIISRDQNISTEDYDPKYNVYFNDPYEFRNSSLKSNNFSFSVSGAYKKNNEYFVDVTVKYINNIGVTPFYSTYLNENVYFVPLKFAINYSYTSDCVTDLASRADFYKGYTVGNPQTKYTCKYRTKEYKWVAEKDLAKYINEGWIKTGIVTEK